MSTEIESLVQGLNPEQKLAVQETEGPVLIVAGAGSGKTRVLTQRIAYLLAKKKVAPYKILAITFTNKAAKEMKQRVAQIVGPEADDIWISTFHSMCVRILRRDIDRLGYHTQFTILDATDQLSVIKECLKQLNIDKKQFEPKTLLGAISSYKNELKSVNEVQSLASHYYSETVAKVYEAYQKMLRTNDALDFDDLIMLTVRLFQEEPDVLAHYQRKFQYIHVDEYQDTNRAQYLLVQMLADQHHNICVVGDTDQSIYAWRGADIGNILSFEKDYKDTKVIKLEQNYRSTKRILQAANQVIQHNTERKEKDLWTDNDEGPKLTYYHGQNEHDEAYFITEKIQEALATGRKYKGFAILYRTNAQSRVVEEVFIKSNIPYQIVGGIKFYARKEIKDTLAYLRLLANPNDDISLTRVINAPKRGIGQATVDKLGAYAAGKGLSLFEALAEVDFIGLSSRAVNSLVPFYEHLKNWMQQIEFLSVTEMTEEILDKSGYRQALQKENTLESKSRLENLEEFISVTLEFEKKSEDGSLRSFLDELALVSDIDQVADEDDDYVLLMTLHSAKGLEFPSVFIVGMEEGIFPHQRALMEESEMEEERRLAYVGITRSEKELYLTNAEMRTIFGQTKTNPESRFIREIEQDLLEDASRLGAHKLEGSSSSARNSRFQTNRGLSGRRPMASSTPLHAPKLSGAQTKDWQAGDRADHAKWGQGTVVSTNGTGDDLELTIAFPKPTGLKKLLAKFAPITKSES